ncbi:MAG TPA: hypothetical protein VIN08_15035 [Ohtaekwangia sp.]|uniref:hypothetical protein n=1 Tax=Ohtaekwangia sp. TaxID=2066019 RepID=UPI002F94E08F
MNKHSKESAFNVGDIVRLPSEEKLVTVESVNEDRVQCVWLKPDLTPEYHEFHVAILVRATKGCYTNTRVDHSLIEN